jgi:hypothetical protein
MENCIFLILLDVVALPKEFFFHTCGKWHKKEEKYIIYIFFCINTLNTVKRIQQVAGIKIYIYSWINFGTKIKEN